MDVMRASESIDALIARRSAAKKNANEEADLWRASERRVLEKRRRENREAWINHHGHMQTLHLNLASTHADKRSRLMLEAGYDSDRGPGPSEVA